MKTNWKTLTEYLEFSEIADKGNRAYYLARIPGYHRQKDKDGHWMINPKCPPLKELGKGTPDPRHQVGAPRKTTNGKDGK